MSKARQRYLGRSLALNFNSKYQQAISVSKHGPVTTKKLTPEQMAKLFK